MAFLLLLGLGLQAQPVEAQHWKLPGSVKRWKTIESRRFRIHYPSGYEEMAARALLFSEEAAARLEVVLQHRLTRVVPVFLYASHQDFAATNMLPGIIGEGTGGFTDFYRRRVVVPFTGDYAALRHVLTHEIVHAYQFDILGGAFGRYPLWLMEGMAEYLSLGWDISAETFIRDAVLHNRMPSLAQMQARRVPGFFYYKGGQALMLFIATRYGENSIGRLLKELRALRRLDYAIESVFQRRAEEFDIAFGKFIRARYARATRREKRDPRLRRITYRYKERVGLNLHPVLSPDGSQVAYVTARGFFPVVVIRKLPGPGVREKAAAEVRIVIKALRSGRYEEWQPFTTRLSFSPDGKRLFLAGRAHGRQAILIIDIAREKVVGYHTPPFDAIQFPSLSPLGGLLVFTGVVRGRADVYLLERKTGRLRRLTNDACHEKTPRFSPGGRYVLFSSNCASEPDYYDRPGSDVYILDLGRDPLRGPLVAARRLTRTPGTTHNPIVSADGSVIVTADFTGVPNLYRITDGLQRTEPVRPAQLIPLTASRTGIRYATLGFEKVTLKSGQTDASKRRELLAFAEMEEGASELKILPGGVASDGSLPPNRLLVTAVQLMPEGERTFDPTGFSYPTRGTRLDRPLQTGLEVGPYRPFLAFEGFPYFLLGGNSLETVALVFFRLADDTGDHRVRAFLNYAKGETVTVNGDLQYRYLRGRTDFFVGGFRQAGAFPLSSIDFSFNNVFYNPNFRVVDQVSTGLYAGAEYPLHRYGAILAVFEHGRDEQQFRPTLAEEREQPDIYRNYQQASLAYRFNNIAYSIFGAMDGTSLTIGYSVPVRLTATERVLYSTSLRYRFFHMFSNYSVFAFESYLGVLSGSDAEHYPLRLGGFNTLRGYRYLEFEGTKAFLFNLEYRFPFIDHLRFSPFFLPDVGHVRGVVFLDAGSAFDRHQDWQGYDADAGVTRDLHLSFGVGVHWVNFLYPFLPGILMKIEWATPYDTKRSLPLSKWRGQFSLGSNF